jgi:hypothetical protein
MADDKKIKIRDLTKAEADKLKRSSVGDDPLMQQMIARVTNPEMLESMKQYANVTYRDLIPKYAPCLDIQSLYQKPLQPKPLPKIAQKKVVPRENEMHVLLERAFKVLNKELKRAPTAKEVWRGLQDRRVEFDTDSIIYKFIGDTIEWRSMARNTKMMTYQAVANRISKIRQKLEKNHR